MYSSQSDVDKHVICNVDGIENKMGGVKPPIYQVTYELLLRARADGRKRFGMRTNDFRAEFHGDHIIYL